MRSDNGIFPERKTVLLEFQAILELYSTQLEFRIFIDFPSSITPLDIRLFLTDFRLPLWNSKHFKPYIWK